jgi:hypothetical protein
MKNALLISLLLSVVPVAAHAADLSIEPEAPAASSLASRGLSGYVEVTGLQTAFWDYEFAGFGITGALAYFIDSNWQIEGELRVQSAFETTNEYSNLETNIAALHLNYHGDSYSVGAFGGVVAMTDYYDTGLGYSVLGGIEAQLALGDYIVIGGQVGSSRQVSGENLSDPVNSVFGQVDMKVFPLDNLKLQASVGMAKGDVWGVDQLDLLSVGLEAEYQFEDSPLSIFASYTYTAEDGFGDDFLDHGVARVGARFSLDGQSLKDQATSGASHKVYDFTGVAAMRWY